jgi:hypothetical protein
MFGDQARVMLRPPVPYGEDARTAVSELSEDLPDAVTAVLFNLAATPEKENHGAFLESLKGRLPRGPLVLVDESGMLERALNQAGAEQRLAERIALWRQFCTYHGMPVSVVNLLQPDKYRLEIENGVGVPGTR